MTKKKVKQRTTDELAILIGNAVTIFDWPDARQLCAEYAAALRTTNALTPATYEILKLLLRNGQYEALTEIAESALLVAPGDQPIRTNYAQALVDQGRIAPALRLFAAIAEDPATPAAEQYEGRGGVGRCYKELALAATHPDRKKEFLRRALEAYSGLYYANRALYWHGINSVALLAYAVRHRIIPEGFKQPNRVLKHTAELILDTVRKDSDPWARATACEAHIARKEYEAALIQADKLCKDDATSAFCINSFLRQLHTVWEVKPKSSLGLTLIPMLRQALALRTGGTVLLDSTDVAASRITKIGHDETYEKVFGADRWQTLQWWRNGLDRCRAVVRIDDLNGVGRGTGFLVNGADLHPALETRVIVVTNAHVVPDGIDIEDAVVCFHGLDADANAKTKFRVLNQIWSSPCGKDGLDTTLLELDASPAGVEPMPLIKRFPVLNETSRAYIIGHPRGYDQPQFSLQDNLVIDHDNTRLQYRAPTEGGSSGSPVFDSQWQVIGLHHAGSETMSRLNGEGTHAANEGLRIDAIRERLSSAQDFA
jgi:tetratricopeptide (TPR) repeat protein